MLEILEEMGNMPAKPVISLIGAGGKTTCTMELARELAEQGKRVLLTTSTHMENPFLLGLRGILNGSAREICAMAQPGMVTAAGTSQTTGGKLSSLEPSVFQVVMKTYDAAVIEADGAKRYFFKVPASHEPVLFPQMTHILILAGMPALFHPLREVCFRFEEAEKLLQQENPVLTPELAGKLLEMSYVTPIRKQFPQAKMAVILNQCKEEILQKRMADFVSVPVFLKEKFPGPENVYFHLIILAAGFSRRFGSNKLLYEIQGKPMYEILLEKLQWVKEQMKEVKTVCVVSQYERIMEAASGRGFLTVKNENSILGLSSSVKAGLVAVRKAYNPKNSNPEKEAHYFCFFAADQPHMKQETILGFLQGFRRSRKGIGCMAWEKQRGNPVIFHEKYVDELLALEGDTGGREVLKRHPQDLFLCQVPDAQELKDYDYLREAEKLCP